MSTLINNHIPAEGQGPDLFLLIGVILTVVVLIALFYVLPGVVLPSV